MLTRVVAQSCMLRIAQRSSSSTINLADADHKKFRFIKGKFTPSETKQVNLC